MPNCHFHGFLGIQTQVITLCLITESSSALPLNFRNFQVTILCDPPPPPDTFSSTWPLKIYLLCIFPRSNWKTSPTPSPRHKPTTNNTITKLINQPTIRNQDLKSKKRRI
uniref:Uncharacterized protein n=1 Tax=Mus spicilegus TaxID=10103 RepID=A0A8C6GFZ9_MUSSI